MFLRTTKAKGKTYLSIVENYYDKGRTRQKNIASLGCLDKFKDTHQLEHIAKALLAFCKERKTIFDVSSLQEKSRKKWGAVRVFRKLWNTFGLDAIFKKITEKKKSTFDFFSAVFLMLLDRLCAPQSKLASYNGQDKYFDIKKNELQHLYRALDILADKKDTLEEYLFYKNVSLFNMTVDVCLYDVTTLYFESVRKDELKKFGYSKDCKFNEVQIVLGLLVDLEGSPIGFDIYPGNTYEGHTFSDALDTLKNRFKINRVIIVGDQGMMSKNNIQVTKDKEYSYIVGSRLKAKSDVLKKEILDKRRYKKLSMNVDDTEEIVKYREIEIDNEKILCTWSKKRAEKDKADRERLIEKAKKMLEAKTPITSRRGALKYINASITHEPTLDEKKIREDEQWDGFYGIQTNCTGYDSRMILNYYHDLWRVEESFRIFKTHLETRPIFHWTPQRIKGHLVLCFIAFLLERTLEGILKKKKIEYSPQKIRKALDELELSEIDLEGQTFFLRSKIEGLANTILRALNIPIPPTISQTQDF